MSAQRPPGVRPRLLILTPRFPYPVVGGDRLRIWRVCRALASEFGASIAVDIGGWNLCVLADFGQRLGPTEITFSHNLHSGIQTGQRIGVNADLLLFAQKRHPERTH